MRASMCSSRTRLRKQRTGSYPIARLLERHSRRAMHLPAQRAAGPRRLSCAEVCHTSKPSQSAAVLTSLTGFLNGRRRGSALEPCLTASPRISDFGLGLLWEYRAIPEAFSGQDQITLMFVHDGNEATLNPPFLILGIRRFHELRKEINRISARYQRDARRDKAHHAYHTLLHAADPKQFPRLRKTLRAGSISDATSGGRDRVTLSKQDRRAAVGLVRSNLEALAQSDTDALLSLKERSSRLRFSS